MSYNSYTPRTRLHSTASPSPLRQASTLSNGSSTRSNDAPSRSSTQSSSASHGFGPPLGHRRGMSEATALSQPRTESYYGGSEDTSASNTYASMRKALRPLSQAPQNSPPPSPEKRPATSSGSATRSLSHTRSQSVENTRHPVFDNSRHHVDNTRHHVDNTRHQVDNTRHQALDSSRHQALDSSRHHAVDHSRHQSLDNSRHHFEHSRHHTFDGPSSPTSPVSPVSKPRPLSIAVSRADSVRAPARDHSSRPFSTHLEKPVLQSLQKSATGHLRTLSKFADSASEDDFSIKSPEQEVVGLHGRRRLQRTDQERAKKTQSAWARSNWMDQQRQFLQAYEYLCHIGEAKEWMEDIIDSELPPAVELEEALRNGVTLAEIVQSVKGHPLRIFRDPKLQYRHSNNYAHFFNFLAEVELPDLFQFELIDLYEKKNVPKVIYCIHALSWLLFRKGIVDFRIGNLVGKLQFEDHELEATQKGLDKSGVSMPNFSGMSANFISEPEPEPEPVESEDDRIDRELAENQAMILDLQAQIRGALVRMRLGDMMQELWDHEHLVADLQSRIRGDWARQISNYRLDMRRFSITLQSAARGYLVRTRQRGEKDFWRDNTAQVLKVQNLFRGRKARAQVQYTRSKIQQHEHGIREFQAAIRGALERLRVGDRYAETRDTEPATVHIQAMVRGALLRYKVDREWAELQSNEVQIADLQAVSRAVLLRQELRTDQESLRQHENVVTLLQAAARGILARKQNAEMQDQLAQTPAFVDLQSASRGFVQRQRTYDVLCQLNAEEPEITQLQGDARGMLLRMEIGMQLGQLEEHDEAIFELQALARGMVVRIKHAEKQRFYRQNMEKVIKIQSFVRGRQQGEAYKSLTSGKNPPVSTVKNFVHLLNDSDIDFDEEIEFERLRKTVVQHVRQNELAEQYVDQLDIKIALLVKNKITLDEVVKHQKHFGGHVGTLLSSKDISSKDPFDLKALNKTSRRKLEQYQELFFTLQTQPQYLARLFRRVREQRLEEKDTKRIEQLTMSMFGLAQKRREEYWLLKLMSRSLREEIDGCATVQEFTRGNFFWTKLFGSFVRSPRDRKFLKELLGGVIRDNIIDNEELDLESDPMQIYKSAINNEELRTGQRSRRDPNVTRDMALKDQETRATFIHNLQDLRDVADQYFSMLEEVLHRMPYGVRYIAQQMFEELRQKFTYEPQEQLLQVAGGWLWRSYIQPALAQPQHWGVVDRGLSNVMGRNLNAVNKVLGQVAAGRLFGGEDLYLQPLNSYVTEAIDRLQDIWSSLIDVRDAEAYFEIDEFNDLFARTKPTLYIKLADVFAIHNLVINDLATLCPSQDDPLREVVRELGSAKNNENELLHVSSTEITLTLNPKFHEQEDPDAHLKSLFMETKRYALYIIRVQTGANLTEILCKPVTPQDEDRWDSLVREEVAAQRKDRNRKHSAVRSSAASTYTTDMGSNSVLELDYPTLKQYCLENMVQLQRAGRISPHNNYQDLLNAIAVDIRTKHRRRMERAREMEGVRTTLAALDEKAHFLEQQLKSYNDYIEQAMVTLQSKKGKKKFLLPFTRQYNHMRELKSTGRAYRFGSFKYSARNLAQKGILVSWNGYPDAQWDRLELTISSNQTGVFEIQGSQGSMMIPGAFAEVPLDGLLQAQFDNHQFMNLFGDGRDGSGNGAVRVNVNLFLHLIFKKFYRDE
ncbi:ras GTPase activating protein-like protein [Boeremia exigua]|uniref:ras GTPase activating protein-like protein n=1 Tax=Boeremia exigua TaxID=749465 RepID=UPI001E8E80B7|nr:ras GTPase activating protein-like protein [Boeremia exigua]KAH6639255.1 ras GTPase activating protein-like protein [Boeremia exigua]